MTVLETLIARIAQLAVDTGNALQARGFKVGGTTGQVPVKNSGTDFDWDWGDAAGGSQWTETGTGSLTTNIDGTDYYIVPFTTDPNEP